MSDPQTPTPHPGRRYGQSVQLRQLPTGLANLPPKPDDGSGRYTSWVLVLSEPGIWYTFPGRTEASWIPIDAKWIADQVGEYARYTEWGYTSPILREHDADGERFGDVLQLAAWTDPDDGQLKLIAAVAWAVEDAEAKIERGQIKYLSAGLDSVSDERGRDFESILVELSIVAAPHQLSIDAGRGTHVLAGQSSTAPNPHHDFSPGGPSVTPEEIEAALAEIREQIAALTGTVTAMQDKKPDDEPEPEPPAPPKMGQGGGTPSPEIVALKQQLATLQAERDRDEFERTYPTGAVIVLSAKRRDFFYELRAADPERFDVLADFAEDPAALKLSQTPSTPTAPTKRIPWGVTLGSSSGSRGAGGASSAKSDDDLYAEAKAEAKGDATKALDLYKEKIAARDAA